MKTAAICLLVVLTCSCHEVIDNLKPNAAEKVGSELLEVESFTLTKENLRLEYRVTNVFPHDIWVCVKMNHHAGQDYKFSVDTEIDDGMVWITRRANVNQHAYITASDIYAVYCRLRPGASRSDIIVLPLPVCGYVPVRTVELRLKPVVLNRVVLELGCFTQDLGHLLPEKGRPPLSDVYRHGYLTEPDTAFVSYISPRRWDKLGLEQSVQAVIPDVNVPGRIP